MLQLWLRVGRLNPDDAHDPKQPMAENIITINEHESEVQIFIDGTKWELHEDTVTRDWSVRNTDDEFPMSVYLKTLNDAKKYVLKQAGVIGDVDCAMAPDRTSA